MESTNPSPRIAVIGLGYVGLPLAVALARHFAVVGYDSSAARTAELKRGFDRTGEVDAATLGASALVVAPDAAALKGADVFIVTVPTPVTERNAPDLDAVRAACRTVGRVMGKGAIVVLESTVYPGVTEEICGPELAAASGLSAGRDFFLGYSPERINPGDREHTVERITKVVSGETPEVARRLAEIYGALNGGNVFVAKSIKTAEAAKVIENAQRDINIAFVNEVTMIFNKLGLSIHDVLAASNTKWNFLPFVPGFVGGHCIGVDPYYLAHLAEALGQNPEVVLAGRRINDGMSAYVADSIAAALAARGVAAARILVLGLTFKENIPDLRNSKVADLVARLRAAGHAVEVHDGHADPAEARAIYGLDLAPALATLAGYDALVGAVAHDEYRKLAIADFARLVKPGGLVADVKGLWRKAELPAGIRRWEL
ncbi:MAG TPA: nucleotide sugar dehydrogenase [Alphaproteobacteria bacterium]|nr:nucleotide sugar dehydrogenase [Alphaproteobacteria bacterium]